MSWKKFKKLFDEGMQQEHYFVLGIDIGNSTSSIAYFDLNQNAPEIIDISGGYGKASVPTVMQYIDSDREWIFGEYALAGRADEKDKFFDSLIEKLGTGEYVEISGKTLSIPAILSIYIKELIGNCKNINPRAEIAGIAVSTSAYLGEHAKAELFQAFKLAGYEKCLLGFYDDRECILNRYYLDKEVKKENLFIIDFGAREIRGGIYEVESSSERTEIDCKAFLFDGALSTKIIDDRVYQMFEDIYCRHFNLSAKSLSEQDKEKIEIFTYQHKDLIFQKNLEFNDIKLYFNFAYPPFQHSIEYAEIEELLSEYKKIFEKFITNVLSKPTIGEKKLSPKDIDSVICIGGGFEMLWARNAVASALDNEDIIFFRNSKSVAAEGASIIAAKEMSILDERKFAINDKSQLDFDLGFVILKDSRERFMPIIESKSFWWQEHSEKHFILNEPTQENTKIEILKRKKDGTFSIIKEIFLDGLPKRPKATTRLSVALTFSNLNKLVATVKDIGFGEMFPASDFEKEFIINF